MKVDIEKLPQSQIKLRIELEKAEFDKYKEKTASEISAHANIPGFRPGFAPMEIVEKHVGQATFMGEVINHCLQETYARAIIDNKLDVISKPKIDIKTENPFVYEAVAAVMPEVKVKDYKSIKIPKEEVKVEDKEIIEIVEDLRKRKAVYKDVERGAKKGDKLEIDFEGFNETGVSLEGTKSKNHPIILGEGVLIKDFEDNLEGLKANDKKEFDITFPANYRHKPFADKKIHFKVEIKKVEEVILPELNNEFVKQAVGEDIGVEELKRRIGENIKAQKEHEAEMKREDALIEKILEHTETEVPPMLLEEEVEYMIEQMKTELKSRNFSYEDYLKQRNKTEEDVKKDFEKDAEKRVKIRFALQQLFKEENIQIDDKEAENEIENIAKMYPENEQTKIKEEYTTREKFNQLKNRLALNKLFNIFLK